MLGGPGGVLMVDCGSADLLLPDGRPFKAHVQESLAARYQTAPRRAFLLTHYHRDHVCGLFDLLAARPGYFDEVYLPCAPCDAFGRALLLEFALFAWAVLPRQAGLGLVNLGALRAFDRVLRAGAPEVYAVGQGDRFSSDNVTYQCLWPPRMDFQFDEDFTDAVDRLRLLFLRANPGERICARFLALAQAFCASYIDSCAQSPVDPAHVARTADLLEQLDALTPALRRLPAARQAAELLTDRAIREVYAAQANAASVVFQNVRDTRASIADVLMTGDATPAVFDAIADQLLPDYYAIKAPHHGTASGWSPLLAGRGAHILISAGAGSSAGCIAPEWPEQAGRAILHCTNPEACAWWTESGCGCARTVCCGDRPIPELALHCLGNRGVDPPCGIRVVDASGIRGCICDPPGRGSPRGQDAQFL